MIAFVLNFQHHTKLIIRHVGRRRRSHLTLLGLVRPRRSWHLCRAAGENEGSKLMNTEEEYPVRQREKIKKEVKW
jgi:hypothetical protein